MMAAGEHHNAIIARFKAYLKAHPGRPLHLIEICTALGTRERTLRAACEQHLGMGPIRYLNLRRMNLARRALARAEPSTTTVTQVATDYGFWELGRFSVSYRALFGETPSETLRYHRTLDRQQHAHLAPKQDIRCGNLALRLCARDAHALRRSDADIS